MCWYPYVVPARLVPSKLLIRVCSDALIAILVYPVPRVFGGCLIWPTSPGASFDFHLLDALPGAVQFRLRTAHVSQPAFSEPTPVFVVCGLATTPCSPKSDSAFICARSFAVLFRKIPCASRPTGELHRGAACCCTVCYPAMLGAACVLVQGSGLP